MENWHAWKARKMSLQIAQAKSPHLNQRPRMKTTLVWFQSTVHIRNLYCRILNWSCKGSKTGWSSTKPTWTPDFFRNGKKLEKASKRVSTYSGTMGMNYLLNMSKSSRLLSSWFPHSNNRSFWKTYMSVSQERRGAFSKHENVYIGRNNRCQAVHQELWYMAVNKTQPTEGDPLILHDVSRFTWAVFQEFSRYYWFEILHSEPRFQQSSGFNETMSKAEQSRENQHPALLAYRVMPRGPWELSPAKAGNQHKFRALLPIKQHLSAQLTTWQPKNFNNNS